MILVALALLSRSTWADIKENGPPGEFFYKVTAKQFNWEITYPGPDGKLGTKDDVTIENEFHVPVNKVVRLDLESKDVIHSFFVPNMRLKQDAVPGPHHRSVVPGDRTRAIRDSMRGAVRLRAFGHEGKPYGSIAGRLRQVAQGHLRESVILSVDVGPLNAGEIVER